MDWVHDLGEEFDLKHEDALISMCLNPDRRAPIKWVGVPVEYGMHRGCLCVASDALALRHPFGDVRVNVSCRGAQVLCDKLGLQMPTPLMIDRVWEAATLRVNPKTYLPDSSGRILVHDRLDDTVTTPMHSLTAMIAHSDRVQRSIEGDPELVCNVGKWWVLTHALGAPLQGGYTCANYGWFYASAPGLSVTGKRLWQPIGKRHNENHRDYSQTFVPVGSKMLVNDQVMTVASVLSDAELCGLLNHDGPLLYARHPSAPQCEQLQDLSPEPGSVPIIGAYMPDRPTRPGKTDPPPMMQARNYRAVGDRKIDYVVIHTMEHPEKPKTATAVAQWFAGPNAPRASAHFCIDDGEVVQCVKECDVAWAAPGTNHNGVHLEHAGYARQTPAEWSDVYSLTMLRRSAKLAAAICSRYNIPVVFVDAEGLLAGVRGITTHAEVSKACALAKTRCGPDNPFFKARTTHTDPGKHFPMVKYLQEIERIARN